MPYWTGTKRQTFDAGELEPYRLDVVDGDLFYIPGWLNEHESDEYYSKLVQTLGWRQDQVKVFGKWHLIPRLQAWYGDADANYQYSGRSLQAQPWTPELELLRSRLKGWGITSNSVLANWYRHGEDRMGWHSDNEPELGARPVIASISLGATRCFQLRHRTSKQRIDLELDAGSLLIMAGPMQKYWQHGLPQRKRCLEGRVNLTFRQVSGRSLSADEPK